MLYRQNLAAALLMSATLPSPAAAQAQASEMSVARYGAPISLDVARDIVRMGRNEAQARGLAMAFAITGPSGDLILLEVMDGTQFASTAIAPAKARTAARFRKPTKVLQKAVAMGNSAYAGADGALALEGGVPIQVGGKIIGGMGVSGGTYEQDGEVASATLQRFLAPPEPQR